MDGGIRHDDGAFVAAVGHGADLDLEFAAGARKHVGGNVVEEDVGHIRRRQPGATDEEPIPLCQRRSVVNRVVGGVEKAGDARHGRQAAGAPAAGSVARRREGRRRSKAGAGKVGVEVAQVIGVDRAVAVDVRCFQAAEVWKVTVEIVLEQTAVEAVYCFVAVEVTADVGDAGVDGTVARRVQLPLPLKQNRPALDKQAGAEHHCQRHAALRLYRRRHAGNGKAGYLLEVMSGDGDRLAAAEL